MKQAAAIRAVEGASSRRLSRTDTDVDADVALIIGRRRHANSVGGARKLNSYGGEK